MAKDDEKNHEKKVEVTLDGKKKKIEPGTYTLAELKDALKVSEERILNELVDGAFQPLDSSKPIVVVGGEIFSTNVPRGGSSWK